MFSMTSDASSRRPPFSLSTNRRWLVAFGVLLLAATINWTYHKRLPSDLPQAAKYKLICFGVDLSSYFGHFLEMTGVSHRVNLTRFQYYWALGAFSVRNPDDQIMITDELIEHVPIRIYKPLNRTHLSPLHPTIIFYHGGGHFVGSADNLEPITYLTAKYTNYQVVYIEFRLIPEDKHPAQLLDSLLVTRHLIANNKTYSIDLDNLVLMGDSAGGNLAASISQTLMQENLVRPKMQVLIYPILQFYDFALPSYQINLHRRVLSNIDHENFKNFLHYLTGIQVDDEVFENAHTSSSHKESALSEFVNVKHLPSELRAHADYKPQLTCKNDTTGKYARLAEVLLDRQLSPLLVDDAFLLKNTPDHVFLMTAEMDILRDDGFIYASRLRQLGINIEHKHYENLFHGVFGLLHGPLKFDVAESLVVTVAEAIKSVIKL